MEAYEGFWSLTQKALWFALKSLGLPAVPNDVSRLLEAYACLKPFEDTKKALKSLSGYPKLILSNGTPSMLDRLVKNAGLGGFFEAVLSVDAARAYRPSPKAYALAFQRLKLDPNELAMVSSNPFDVIDAKRSGMRSVWVTRSNRPMDDLGYTPDLTLNFLLDLHRVLAL
jgi:2-haloacid dehalogenase